jgi:hypothetical protein
MLAMTPQTFYGTTLLAHPTLLVYVPTTHAQEAIFSLKDEEQNMIYQATVLLTGKGGVVAIQLPENAPALEVGKSYQWYFALKLDGTLSPNSPYVDAWIQRIEPSVDLAQRLEQGTSLQNVATLAAHGIWYDCASTLTALRMSDSRDTTVTERWHQLLNSVGLEAVVAAYPITSVH